MELLVRVVDKGEAESAGKNGDVIAICPDGWAWSDRERMNSEWRIVKADITEVEADALTSPPMIGEGARRRRFRLNLDGFSGDTLSRSEINQRVFF